MKYYKEIIKEGIKAHFINTDKYKTNLATVFLTVPLKRTTVTKNALITSILRLGTMNLKTQEEINKKLEEMYGAEFNCGIEKIGDNQIIKFYIEVINDEYVKENLLEQSLNLLFEIIFNPLIINNSFNQDYIDMEKVNLKNIIESKINNKDQYAFTRCIEEMYKDEPYSIYKYGYSEDIKNITNSDLIEQYENLINNSKIDIYVSGNYNQDKIVKNIYENENIKKLNLRNIENTKINSIEKHEKTNENVIKENKNVVQGKLVFGLDIKNINQDSKYVISVYNMILGAAPTSKLFQNVREKASLAYTARSLYIRQKDNLFIRCGIEIKNYEKAVKIIKEQIEAMKNGEFFEDDIEIAKKNIISTIKTIRDEQDSQISYFISRELEGIEPNFEEYIEKINSVTKEQIVEIANNININTIYFLTK